MVLKYKDKAHSKTWKKSMAGPGQAWERPAGRLDGEAGGARLKKET
jgi:hypothetical protein